MHLPSACVFFMVSGGLCAIGSICNLQDDRKGETELYTGTCQQKSACMKFGFAAVLKNSDDKKACPDDDESIQCCVDISCGTGAIGSNRCLNNIDDNPCETGSYKSGVRNHLYCPFTATDAKLECCVSTAKVDLKARDFFDEIGGDDYVAYGNVDSEIDQRPASNLNLDAYDSNPIDIQSKTPESGGTFSANANIVNGLTSLAKGNFNLNDGGAWAPSVQWKSPTDFGAGSQTVSSTAPEPIDVAYDYGDK